MNLSKTDTKELIRFLDDSYKIMNSINPQSTKEANVIRKCRLLRKKIIRNVLRTESKS
jgi:hypothetical protein